MNYKSRVKINDSIKIVSLSRLLKSCKSDSSLKGTIIGIGKTSYEASVGGKSIVLKRTEFIKDEVADLIIK